MPVDVPKTGAPKGAAKGKGLNAKIAGIPVWVIALGVVAAIGVGLYIRNKSATAATTAAATPASGTDTTGGAGSAGATPQDLTPAADNTDLINALNGLTGMLGAGIPITVTTTPDTTTTTGTSPYPINDAGVPGNTSYNDLGVVPDAIPLGGKSTPTLPALVKEPALPKLPINSATTVKPAAPAATAVKYQTFKANVKLGPGQVLGFTPGKGYYAKTK